MCVVNTFLSDGSDGSTCQAACLNGGSCSGSKCVCRTGYQGEFCGERTFVLRILTVTGILLQMQKWIQTFLTHRMVGILKCNENCFYS
jgi:hypothetical protein